jgi:hypothetical protein
MEIGLGQRYTLTVENLTVPTNSGTAFDLVQLATSSAVPIIVDRIVATAGVTSGAIQRLQLLRRTTTGTGGTGATPNPVNASAPAASTTCSYNVVTTVGTAGAALDSQQWNEFAPYEFNQRPGGVLVPVSSFLSLYIPSAPGSTYVASFTVEFIELK